MDAPKPPVALPVGPEGCSSLGIPGDFDRDGDVDQSDLGHLQVCLSGRFIPQTDPACQDAKLNADDFVDTTDVNIFLRCMTGSRIPADPNCME